MITDRNRAADTEKYLAEVIEMKKKLKKLEHSSVCQMIYYADYNSED